MARYRPCVRCGYWVEPDCRACPNCGRAEPGGLRPGSLVRRIAWPVLAGLGGGFLALQQGEGWFGDLAPAVPLAVAVLAGLEALAASRATGNWGRVAALAGARMGVAGLIGGWISLIVGSNAADSVLWMDFGTGFGLSGALFLAIDIPLWLCERRPSTSRDGISLRPLVDAERDVQAVLDDLRVRERHLAEARLRAVTQLTGSDQAEALAAIAQARAARDTVAAECAARRLEILIARWQNTIAPLAADWDGMDYAECARRSAAIDQTFAVGEALLAEWKASFAADSAPVTEVIRRLEFGLGAAGELRQALLLQQAALAAGAVTPSSPDLRPNVALSIFDPQTLHATVRNLTKARLDVAWERKRLEAEEQGRQ